MLKDMMMRLLTSLQPTHLATTAAEKEAIYRLRFQVYCEEENNQLMLQKYGDRGLIHTPEDDDDHTELFYVGDPAAPDATGRAAVYRPGEIPDDIVRTYSLENLPALRHLTCLQANYFIARRSARGSRAAVSLLAGAAEHTVRTHGAEVLFGDCVPGLLSAYRRLGMRPYGGRMIQFEGGMLVPVISVLSDVERFASIGSPLYPTLKRLKRDGCFPSSDLEPLKTALQGPAGIETSTERISTYLEQTMVRDHSSFLERLPASARARLTEAGFVLDVQPGTEIIREGFREREMYLLIDGVYEVRHADRLLDTIGPGELCGELAFFHPDGVRTATVRAVSPGKVLVLRHRFLERMRRSHPDDAFAIIEALAAVLAERAAAIRRSAG